MSPSPDTCEPLLHPQLMQGMGRAVLGLSDLSLDVPDAPTRLDSIADGLVADGLLPASFKVPPPSSSHACLRAVLGEKKEKCPVRNPESVCPQPRRRTPRPWRAPSPPELSS